MSIEVKRGSEADALLADEQFRAEWTRLCDGCPWGTPMQSHAFAATWYAVYRARFEPVLIILRGADGRLDGLLPLAFAPKRTLLHVGGHQAEYQCWISTPEVGQTFGRDALRAVRKAFPSAPLTLRYLPPDVPLSWLDQAPDIAGVSLLTPWKRPLMRLDGETIQQRAARRNIKTRLNKLSRMGYAGIERITDPDRWEQMFDQFIGYHDMRRIAVGGTAPFADDPLKKQFHVELMRRGAPLCVTVLKVGGEVVSAQLDVVGPNDAHLALGSYAPWMAKHALGKIHIIEMARLMMEEGRTRIDLTPGDDPYKSDFATEWDTVHVFAYYPSRFARCRAMAGRTAERVGRRAVQRWDTTPARVRMWLGEAARRPAAALANAMLAVRDRFRSSDETLIYARCRRSNGRCNEWKGAAPVLRRNSIADLMAYRPRPLGMAVHAYMSQVSERLARGMIAYTHADGGRLRYAGWVTDEPEALLDDATRASLSIPPRCGVVFDVQSHDDALDATTSRHALEELVAEAEDAAPDAEYVYVLVPRSNAALRKAVEGRGFKRAGTSARAAGLNSLRKPPVAEMVALASVAAAFALWGCATLGEISAMEQDPMPIVAETQEILPQGM
jgi:CelD/BcsL family acetyltransferase involved in cellulose biosynthesis